MKEQSAYKFKGPMIKYKYKYKFIGAMDLWKNKVLINL